MEATAERARARGTYRWVVVALLWFVCFFNYADRQAIFSVFTPIQTEMFLSDAQLGVVGSAFMWVYALTAPLAGLVGDRLRRKSLIIGGLVFWSLICAATALSTQYWHLVLFRALEGFGEAFYFPASMALISDYHDPRTRSRALSIHQSSVYVGTVAGGSLSGYLGAHHGWRSSFYLLGGLGLVLGIVLLAFLKEPPSVERERAPEDVLPEVSRRGAGAALGNALAAIREVLASPMVLILMAVFVAANFVAAVFLTWLPTYLVREFKMSLPLSGFSGTAYLHAASIGGVLAGGVLADRLARRTRNGRMLVQMIGLFLGGPFIVLIGSTTLAAVLIAAVAVFGFFKGMYDSNIWASFHDFVRPERRASVVGLANAVGWVGGSLAPLYIGAASGRFGMGNCIAATAVVYLLGALLLAAAIRRRARSRPAAPGRTLISPPSSA